MPKWLKWLFLVLASLAVALSLTIYFGGRWAVKKYLRNEVAVGPGKLRVARPRFFGWGLKLQGDSLLYASPALRVESGRVSVSIGLFRSLFHFSPSLDVRVDTLDLTLLPVPPDTTKKKRDTLAFPDFRLPATVDLRTSLIRIADDSGSLASLGDLELASGGPKRVTLAIRRIGSRYAGRLTASLGASFDWDSRDSVLGMVGLRHGRDSVTVAAKLEKQNLMRGSADLRARIASSRGYAQTFGAPETAPAAEGVRWDFHASMAQSLSLESDLHADLSGFSKTAAYRLSPQKVSTKIAFRDRAGTWSLASHGEGGEEADLSGDIFLTATDSLANPAYVASHLGLTSKGRIRGVTVVAGNKAGPVKADVDLLSARLSRNAAKVDMQTGDGSHVLVDLTKLENAPTRNMADSKGARTVPGRGWRGGFSAELVPGERWVTAFADTNLVYRRLSVRGTADDGVFSAVTEASGLKAFGVMADSVRLNHRYGPVTGNVRGTRTTSVAKNPGGYELLPSQWHYRGTTWALSGRVALGKPGNPLSFHLENPEFGSVDFAMPRPTLLQAKVRGLAVEKLPYRGLDTLSANKPRVTADFTWDKKASSGAADADVSGRFRGEGVQVRLRSEWTRETLDVKQIEADMSGSNLKASARVRLHGRPFYEVAKAGIPDYEAVSLEATRFDLAKALAVALPRPPLDSGVVTGSFAYSDKSGFDGAYHFRGLHLLSAKDLYAVKELDVLGRGDTLVIRGVTVSSKEPLMNDSVTLALGGALAEKQTVSAYIKAGADGGKDGASGGAKSNEAKPGSGLTLEFRGAMKGYKDIDGRLGIRGGIALPGKSGEVRDLLVKAAVAMEFKQGMRGLRFDADTLGGDYIVAGLDTQAVSAPLHVRDGKISIPALKVAGRSAAEKNPAELNGHLEYSMTGNRLLRASLAGSRLAAQLGPGDKVQLREIRVDVRADSSNLDLQAAIGSGSAEHVQSPMRAAGDFSRVSVFYRSPLGNPRTGEPGGGPIPYLRVQATLDSSTVRYRIRSFEGLQNLFKRPERRQARRERPMQVKINLETAGQGNTIDTDILRLSYVGNISIYGTYPYELVQGRFSSYQGQLGIKRQAFDIHRMEVKWLNEPVDEGEIYVDAEKRLAKTCESNVTDSCMVISRLTGRLGSMQYSYDSDCQGAYGTGANVAALVFSMRRGCYSGAFSGGNNGMTPQEQAMGLLEPLASNYLSMGLEKASGNLIASAQVTGLGALVHKSAAADTATSPSNPNNPNRDAVALEVLSKEFWRMRIRAKSAYTPDYSEQVNPWSYRVGLEWKPPIFRLIDDPIWQRRVKNNVSVEAAVFTDPDRIQDPTQDQVRRRLGLNYTYDFWGYWWSKKEKTKDLGAPPAAPPPVPVGANALPAGGPAPVNGGPQAGSPPVPLRPRRAVAEKDSAR